MCSSSNNQLAISFHFKITLKLYVLPFHSFKSTEIGCGFFTFIWILLDICTICSCCRTFLDCLKHEVQYHCCFICIFLYCPRICICIWCSYGICINILLYLHKKLFVNPPKFHFCLPNSFPFRFHCELCYLMLCRLQTRALCCAYVYNIVVFGYGLKRTLPQMYLRIGRMVRGGREMWKNICR